MKKIDSEIRALLRDVISRREKQMKSGEMKTNDLLGMLIESNLKEIEDQGNRKDGGMSMEDVIDNCKLFYFAGQDTTSSLLLWTIVMLARHQNWQERAREETFQVFGQNTPYFEGLNRLKIVSMHASSISNSLQPNSCSFLLFFLSMCHICNQEFTSMIPKFQVSMILNEVLRFYPPAIMMYRTTQETAKIGDITLPAGVDLLVHILLVHHDTEIWGDDAKEFNPERFSEGVARAARKPNSFFPFSLGPRVCVGQNYAVIETKMAIANFLQHFSFELSPSYTHAPAHGVTLHPRFGAKMIVHKI